MYSLVPTARANELEPYAYLCRLFAELPAVLSQSTCAHNFDWKGNQFSLGRPWSAQGFR
jgi:IS66 C-terminal element